VLEGIVTLTPVNDLDALVRDAEALRRPAPAPPAWTWSDAASATWQVYLDARSARTPGPGGRWRVLRHAGARSPNGAESRRRA
jgi:hypothetical protein